MRPSSRLILPPFGRRRDDLDPGLAIINDRAVGFFVVDEDTQEYGNKVPGSSDAMTRGSGTGTDTNDPTVHSGLADSGFVYFDGGAGNYWQTASSIATAGSADEWIVEWDFGSVGFVPPSSGQDPLGGWTQSISSGGALYVNTDGTVRVLGGDGTLGIDSVTTAAVTTGVRYLRGRYESGVGVHVEETNDRDGSWSLVETIAAPTLGALSQAARIYLGVRSFISRTGGWEHPLTGLRAFTDGVEVGRILASDNTSGSQVSFTAGVGGVVQASRSTYGLKTLWIEGNSAVSQLDGVDDYFQLPAACTPSVSSASGGTYTAFLLGRRHDNVDVGNARVFSTEYANNDGLLLYITPSSGLTIGAGGSTFTADSSGVVPNNAPMVMGFRVDGSIIEVYHPEDGYSGTPASYSGVGMLDTHLAPRIGSQANAVTNCPAMDIYAAVVFQEALNDEDTATVVAYLESLV